MNRHDLQNVVGEMEAGKPVKIKFFGHITSDMASRFNSEFEFVENIIKPSRIDILINCEGGSVLHGMSSFAVIQNSSIPTRCINEGMAASMGSVILVSGGETFLKDYSITMMHNPFLPEHKEEETPAVVKAFTKQLETIYEKRFGFSKDKVRAIMSGEDGEDGTYFDAFQAVEAGIIPAENIIVTSQQVVSKVKSQLQDLSTTQSIQKLFEQVIAEAPEDFKQSEEPIAIHNQENASEEEVTHNKKTNNMPEPQKDPNTVGFVEASLAIQLGLKDYDASSVAAKISDLLNTEASHKTLKTEFANMEIVLASKTQEVDTLTQNLASTQSKLDVFLAKEKAEKDAAVEKLVQDAIDEGKIKENTKSEWVSAATSNMELVKNLFADLPARDKISEEIKQDKHNADNVQSSLSETEAELQAKVVAVVGEQFSFNKID